MLDFCCCSINSFAVELESHVVFISCKISQPAVVLEESYYNFFVAGLAVCFCLQSHVFLLGFVVVVVVAGLADLLFCVFLE